MLIKFLALQAIVFIIIFYVLRKVLEGELISALLEALALRTPSPMEEGAVAFVVWDRPPHRGTEQDLLALLREKFPGASVESGVSREIRGGVVVRVGDIVMDYALSSRLGQLFPFGRTS
ncbi:MAG: F0F1 ATP synthase subunit delta [Elusimicrobia bacterium]|nr:F0F1 ATP synthase subunit delta [Elusimicrobiota bacterium]